jgi:hypothetical protein
MILIQKFGMRHLLLIEEHQQFFCSPKNHTIELFLCFDKKKTARGASCIANARR